MENPISNFIKSIPIEMVYGIVAIIGGSARYLNSFTQGHPFRLRVFIASGFVAGFSGYMFALVGETLQLQASLVHIMAGVGGFFGDQTMKLVLEYVNTRIPKA